MSNYRNAYKSDHLAKEDVLEIIEEEGRCVLTIDHVDQKTSTEVAGRTLKIANIAYFTDKTIKPMVLNAGNAKQVSKFCKGSIDTDDFNDVRVELYVDKLVKFAGETVGGIRIKSKQPKAEKPATADEVRKLIDGCQTKKELGSLRAEIIRLELSDYANEKLKEL